MKILDVRDDRVDPIPWKRPRDRSRGGRFTDPRVLAHKHELEWLLKAGRTGIRDPVEEPVALSIVYRATRGDVDNLAKLLLDAGNGLIWADDRWIRELHVYLVRPNGHTGLRAVAETRSPVVPLDLR